MDNNNSGAFLSSESGVIIIFMINAVNRIPAINQELMVWDTIGN